MLFLLLENVALFLWHLVHWCSYRYIIALSLGQFLFESKHIRPSRMDRFPDFRCANIHHTWYQHSAHNQVEITLGLTSRYYLCDPLLVCIWITLEIQGHQKGMGRNAIVRTLCPRKFRLHVLNIGGMFTSKMKKQESGLNLIDCARGYQKYIEQK